MEFLVTMTTNVPAGTSEDTVADVREREAEHSRDLAAQHHLLRLWRPPLQPGEWRTLGLFAADDAGRLEQVLASMPLRIWRSDDVTPLSPHPNDPVEHKPAESNGSEFLTTFTLSVPADARPDALAAATAREADSARDLADAGRLLRLWKLPGDGRALGLWNARDSADMEAIVESLPLNDWMVVRTTPLSPHPGDPAKRCA
ncbi:MAG TPA: muconolactone Delta-isomerase family protein [Micromonosporaceae bacterium]